MGLGLRRAVPAGILDREVLLKSLVLCELTCICMNGVCMEQYLIDNRAAVKTGVCKVEEVIMSLVPTTTYILVPIGYIASLVAQSPGSAKVAECSPACAPVERVLLLDA